MLRSLPNYARKARGQLLAGMVLVVVCVLSFVAFSQTPPGAKAVGTVKSISGNTLVLSTDSGSEINLTFTDASRIVRATPGQTDLKSATAIQLSDIQVGDRIAARGQPGEGNSVVASSALVMKQSDISERQQHERDEWRRGVGGIVKEVNTAAGTVTIANAMAASGKPIVIHISPETGIRRYSPDSVKFDEAKPGTLDQIKAGDQVRARGTKNADDTEFTAQAIVSGAFRNIAGTVVSTDAAHNSVTITDLVTRKPVVVKVTADSQLRRLPQPVAMGIAMRLKGGATGSANGSGAASQQMPPGARSGASDTTAGRAGEGAAASGRPGGNWRGNAGGAPDFQQMLSRMPAATLSELNKGDAIILVATEGSATSEPTAITLLAGVEPILSAAPSGVSASSILSPWNLGTPPGAGGDASAP